MADHKFAHALFVAGVLTVAALPSNGEVQLEKFMKTVKAPLANSVAILREMHARETGQSTTSSRGRRDTCNEDEYLASIDLSGVDMTAYQNFFTQCSSFFTNFGNKITNGSTCNDPCLQPSLSFFRLAATGTAGGNCTEVKAGLTIATTLFEKVTCPTNENGDRCGDILTQIGSDIYNPAQCASINDIGCCYNKIVDILDDATFQSLTGFVLPVNDTILASAQQTIRNDCGSNFPNVFSASCATATPGNGIAESNIPSGIPNSGNAGVSPTPSMPALAMVPLLSLAALYAPV
eukprot:m.24268 g.24268  ORF g.24268 m.24268 type:complete len:292 (+) comp13033_c0_seq1:243-1118(+)